MGNYVNNNLGKEEKVIYEAKLHWIFWVAPILEAIVTSYIASQSNAYLWIVPALIMIRAYYLYKSFEYVLTNKRVINKYGIIRRHVFELKIEKIETVRVDQGILGRILNYGSVVVLGTQSQSGLSRVAKPLDFRTAFNELTD